MWRIGEEGEGLVAREHAVGVDGRQVDPVLTLGDVDVKSTVTWRCALP